MNSRETARDEQRVKTNREELTERIARLCLWMALKRCSKFFRPCIEAVGIIEYGLPAGVLPRAQGRKGR